MKYLFILLLGLGFSQTELTTRVYELPISFFNGETSVLDIYDLTGLDLEYGIISIIKIENLDLNFESSYLPLDAFLQAKHILDGAHIWSDRQRVAVFPDYDELSIRYDSGVGNLLQDLRFKFDRGSGSFNVFLSITAEFPQESDDLGDMNEDGNIDVLDVIALVNVILDEDSGDIFDVMEFVKKV